MKTQEYALMMREKLGGISNLKIEEITGIPNQRVGDYIRGTRQPDNYAIEQFALILGINEELIRAEIEAEWEKNEKRRDFWKKKLADMGGIAASIFFAVIFIMTPYPTEAAPSLTPPPTVCILC